MHTKRRDTKTGTVGYTEKPRGMDHVGGRQDGVVKKGRVEIGWDLAPVVETVPWECIPGLSPGGEIWIGVGIEMTRI